MEGAASVGQNHGDSVGSRRRAGVGRCGEGKAGKGGYSVTVEDFGSQAWELGLYSVRSH